MKREKVKYTHYGMFGFCPVLYAHPESEAPCIVERHWFLFPIFMLNEWFFAIYFWLMGLCDPNYEPMWKLRVDGELDEPIYK